MDAAEDCREGLQEMEEGCSRNSSVRYCGHSNEKVGRDSRSLDYGDGGLLTGIGAFAGSLEWMMRTRNRVWVWAQIALTWE